jgi:predicted dinucleotide-binding enzyme
VRAQPVRITIRGNSRIGTAIAGVFADLKHQVTHGGSSNWGLDEVSAAVIGTTCVGVVDLDDLSHGLTDSCALRISHHPTKSEYNL